MEFEQWFSCPTGTFFVSTAYLEGARDAQKNIPFYDVYPPGPNRAQYSYGYHNERSGYHDKYDPPFERINN